METLEVRSHVRSVTTRLNSGFERLTFRESFVDALSIFIFIKKKKRAADFQPDERISRSVTVAWELAAATLANSPTYSAAVVFLQFSYYEKQSFLKIFEALFKELMYQHTPNT